MVELRAVRPAVVHVIASPEGCSVAATLAGSLHLRVGAVDGGEMLVFGAAAMDGFVGSVVEVDPDATVLDVGDGWETWELRGPDASEAFARLSELVLPEDGFVQGEVARLPAKVFASRDTIAIAVPAMWGDYLGERIRSDCASVGIREMAP